MQKIIFILLFILIPTIFCEASIGPPPRELMIQTAIKYGKIYNVDPALILGVAYIESRDKTEANRPGYGQEFRYGPLGRGTYFGPMGIFKGCAPKLDKANLENNVMLGARALQGVGYHEPSQRKRLTKYNASFDDRYWWAVKKAKAKYNAEIALKK